MDGMALMVDETPIDFGDVSIFPQKEPFPGGHRFAVTSVNENWLTLPFSELEGEKAGIVSNTILQDLAIALSGIEVAEPKFILNKVLRAEKGTDENIVITGICSPLVKHD